MQTKRPYTHILKNLFHEQAAEIVPLLLPGYRIEQPIDVELPAMNSIEIEGPPGKFEEGIVGLVLPGATIVKQYQTEWIQNSGTFERAYLVQSPETSKPSFLVIEVQTEREDEMLPRRLVLNFAMVNHYAGDYVVLEEDDDEIQGEVKGTIINKGYYVFPYVLCPFPSAIPAHIHDEFNGMVLQIFKFGVISLWEKDARELLNTHVSAIYYLLPAMKNADAALLGLAIDELARRFQDDTAELGRHLTGMSLMLQQSEVMPDKEKLAAQAYLQQYAHFIKHDPYEE